MSYYPVTNLPPDWFYCQFGAAQPNNTLCFTLSNFAGSEADTPVWWHDALGWMMPLGSWINECQQLINGLMSWSGAIPADRNRPPWPHLDWPNHLDTHSFCLGLPKLIQYFDDKLLPPVVQSSLQHGFELIDRQGDNRSIYAAADAQAARVVQAGVEHCLTNTCDAARDPSICGGPCAFNTNPPNTTTPDGHLIQITQCLGILCNNNASLPYADSDMLGVGIWTSYVIQCIIAIFGVVVLYALNHPFTIGWGHASKTTQRAGWRTTLGERLSDFHKAQCYLSIAIQIALIRRLSDLTRHDQAWTMNQSMMMAPICVNALLPVGVTHLVLTQFRLSNDGTLRLITIISLLIATAASLFAYLTFVLDGPGIDPILTVNSLYPPGGVPGCGGWSGFDLCIYDNWQWPFNYQMRSGMTYAYLAAAFGWASFAATFAMKGPPRQGLFIESGHSKRSYIYMFLYQLTVWSGVAFVCFQVFVLDKLKFFVDFESWTFGQIIAVTTWAIPLLDLAQSGLRLILRRVSRHLQRFA